MIDLLRALMPQIMSVLMFLTLLWIIVYVLLKNIPDAGTKRMVKKIALAITAVVLIGFVIFATKFTVVNEIPRSTIDRSGTQEGRDNFQRKMEEEAAKPIIKTDSTKKTGDKK